MRIAKPLPRRPAAGPCSAVRPRSVRAFLRPSSSYFLGLDNLDSAQVDEVCRKLSIDALVVKDTDSVWKDKSSWVWKKEPLIGNAYAPAFLCGTGNDGPKEALRLP